MEDRKNASIQNISILGISEEKIKRLSEAYDNSKIEAEEEKEDEPEPNLRFSDVALAAAER